MEKSVNDQEVPFEDSVRRSDSAAPAASAAWLCLAAAALLLLFSNGANTIALAAWLSPVFLLRFVRQQRVSLGLPIAYLLLVLTFAFQFRGMIPIPGFAHFLFLAAWGLSLLLPYAIDRFLAHRLSGLAATLVFPTAWVAVEYAMSRAPYGTWGSAAYSQYGHLALLQLLSVTGLWGITFLIGWFAAVGNGLWAEGLHSAPARRAAALCAGTILTVMLLGGARLALFPPASPTVRVASISARDVAPRPEPAIMGRVWTGHATPTDEHVFQTWSAATNQDLLARSAQEMQAGAKIVFWSEVSAQLLPQDESSLLARGAALAVQHHAYLGMALAVLHQGETPSVENKFVLLQPDGPESESGHSHVAWEYNKARPVPGSEAFGQIRGDGKLHVLPTPYGRVSSIICFDGDFPQVSAQAGALHVDVMLDPASDWRAVDPWHTQMASFRAIEQGFNLIRQTSDGRSAAYDYQGRQLSSVDFFRAPGQAMVAQVPTRGVWTLYSRLGDGFAWLCILGLAVLTIFSLRPHRF